MAFSPHFSPPLSPRIKDENNPHRSADTEFQTSDKHARFLMHIVNRQVILGDVKLHTTESIFTSPREPLACWLRDELSTSIHNRQAVDHANDVI